MATLEKIEIALVRLSSLGDILHALPLAQALKNINANFSLTWFVEKRFASLLRLFPVVDHLVALDLTALKNPAKAAAWCFKQLLPLLLNRHPLQRKPYHAIVDPQGLFKSGLVVWLLKSDRKIGFSRSNSREFSWLFYTHRVETKEYLNLFEKNLALVKPLTASVPQLSQKTQLSGKPPETVPPTLAFRPDPQAERTVNIFLRRCAVKPLVILHPWASFYTKLLSPELLRALLPQLKARYGATPVVLAGPSERSSAEKALANLPAMLAPLLSLPALFSLIAKADFFIGADSGPSFISALLGRRTVLLFGPTNRERQAPPSWLAPRVKSLYSSYQCPIIKPAPIATPYRCLQKQCADNQCMKHFTPKQILLALEQLSALPCSPTKDFSSGKQRHVV